LEAYYALNQFPLNAWGQIVYIKESTKMRRRLWDLGFTNGAIIKALYVSPSGNPKAYLIRGSVIALRNEDAGAIVISPKEKGSTSWD